MLISAVFLLQERMLSQSGVNARSRDVFGLRCLPGKIMLLRTTVEVRVFKSVKRDM